MIYSPDAVRQISDLEAHYAALGRIEALRNLDAALHEAERLIEHSPGSSLPAPRPYPGLADLGCRWIKVGRYWIAYRGDPPNVVSVFHDAADIPGRLPPL